MNMLGSRDVSRSSDSNHSAGPSRIKIFVLFTGVRKTLDALWSAGRLARDLHAHIEIIAPEIVPYPLPLDEPPVLRSFWGHRYGTIVEQAGIDTSIQVCLCRNPREAVDRLLPRDRLWSSEPATGGGPHENTVSAGGYARRHTMSSSSGQNLPQK